MQDVKSPIIVDIKVEQITTLIADAFSTVCFITNNDTVSNRSVRVSSLNELISAGYTRSSLAYNFCRAVFAQKRSVQVVIRNKRTTETYEEALASDDNSGFYFVVLETKVVQEVLAFNEFINSDRTKLQFFSTDQDVSSLVGARRLVYYYQPDFFRNLQYDSGSFVELDSGRLIDLSNNYFSSSSGTEAWLFDNQTLSTDTTVTWDTTDRILLEFQDYTKEQADLTPTIYPEAAWIGRCAGTFPSRIQWLFKDLVGVDSFELKQIPMLSNTSVLIRGNKSTIGVGATTRGFPIDQEISLDWLWWSIQKNCWNLLYNSEKVNATNAGLSQFEQRIKEPLEIAVKQGIFSSYQITERKLDRQNNKVSFKFTANLLYSILGVDKVEGVVYQ